MHLSSPAYVALALLSSFTTRIIFGEQRNSWSYPFSSSPLWIQTPSSVIILSLCTWFNEKDEASHPHKTWGKFTVLHIIIFIFLDTRVPEKKRLVPLESGAAWVQCSLNFFMKYCRFVRVVPKYLTFATLSKNVLAIFFVLILSCIMFKKGEYALTFLCIFVYTNFLTSV